MLSALLSKKALSGSLLAIICVLIVRKYRKPKKHSEHRQSTEIDAKKRRGRVDAKFLHSLKRIVKIVIPNWHSWEVAHLLGLTVLLVVRTMLSINIAAVNGSIVKAIVTKNWQGFVKKLLVLAVYAIPASTINSGLDYLNKRLALLFRSNLSRVLNTRYMDNMTFYKMKNLDSRIMDPDQRLTQDVEKLSMSLAQLYGNLTKPILDIILFSKKLAELLGWEGPITIILWYLISGVVIRIISPTFGRLVAKEQEKEGRYRAVHKDVVTFSEEIAFYRGSEWELRRVNETFRDLMRHARSVNVKRFLMGNVDSMLVKYGATIAAYGVLGLPVFGPNKDKYLSTVKQETGAITRDYIRNSSLLINLSKAIGRIMVSYKEVQSLAGYSTLITETIEVMDDIQQDKYTRNMVENLKVDMNKRGNYHPSEELVFKNVPIVTPNGELLVESLDLTIKPGMHTFIQGPNGCGKSSLFRILGELWPLFGGDLGKPDVSELFYIPQRPYLPNGTLRDQVIYPHKTSKLTDDQILDLLDIVDLRNMIIKYKGLDTYGNWQSILASGEKQRMAMARLLYHKPKFAILDECTSTVTVEAEGLIYEQFKNQGITCITVSHRESLLKYHDWLLKLDGPKEQGGWTFTPLEES